MNNWLDKKLNEFNKLQTYVKPEKTYGLKMNSNENLVISKNLSKKILLNAIKNIDLREYPLEQIDEFYDQLSKYTKINKKYLAIGNGSDQIIDLILSIFGRDQKITTFVPTFSYFLDRCKLYNISINEVELNSSDNSLDINEFIRSGKKSKIVYICSPNNPTSNQVDKKDIIRVLKNLKDSLILIDEAYVEFGKYNIASEIRNFENLIVLRTLSKGCGLAGARLGYLISNEKFAALFKSVIQYPYPINTLSLIIGRQLLSDVKYIENSIKAIKKERKRILFRLSSEKNIKVYRSDANFIFVQILDNKIYNEILNRFKKEKISVKVLGNIKGRVGRYIRITIGTKKMNDKLLVAMCI
ncbi:MAG: pyridoxal phosphate-dependent aminotransferase [Nitrososphaeraceae archaeon]